MNKEKNHNYYEAVIFDLNGTLIDIYRVSEYYANLKQITELLKVEHEKFKIAWKESWRKYPYGDYPSVRGRFMDAFTFYFEEDDFTIPVGLNDAIKVRLGYIEQQQNRIRPGVIDALEWVLGKGYKIGMISNCSTETSVLWPKNPLIKYFPDPTLSCVVKMKKPEPEIFLNETEKLRVDPTKCIYVADGDDGELTTAKALGMETILVKYDLQDTYRHKEFPEAEYNMEDFNDLPEIIRKIEAKKKM